MLERARPSRQTVDHARCVQLRSSEGDCMPIDDDSGVIVVATGQIRRLLRGPDARLVMVCYVTVSPPPPV